MPVHANKSIVASAGADTDWVVFNQFDTPFNVAFGVYASGDGAATVQVQHTFNQVGRGETAHIFSHEDVSAAAVVSANVNTIDGNYAFPIEAARLHVTSVSGSTTLHFVANQAGL